MKTVEEIKSSRVYKTVLDYFNGKERFLTPFEESLLRLHYGIDDGNVKSAEEVAKELNVDVSVVYQSDFSAIAKLYTGMKVKPENHSEGSCSCGHHHHHHHE